MDRTSISLGSQTRNKLRRYKQERELPNYDAALRDLLDSEDATA
ncbi:hypothetical protein PM033_17470 [Halorubrum ezzemoulense]|nr:hypothetical protein [Halorubrum ezzemoulense]MDB2253513.1 hypothetical protein [Halorubrum ezzemoulense]